MKAIKALLVIFLLGAIPAWGGSLPSEDQLVTVIDVTDGDTLTVMDSSGKKTKVRLYGIDTPEMDQPYGLKAKASLSQMILGEEVKVYSWWNPTRWGREVGIVVKGDLDVAWTLTTQGLAWVDPNFCHDLVICPDYLTRMETAKESRRGLWADGDAVPPWEWRKDGTP